jgi:hypothetical protein
VLQVTHNEAPLQLQVEPAARTWKYYASLINDAWRRSAEAFIQTGKYLLEAKEELDRDQFEALVRLRLDFDASVARKLMRIAGDRALCAHVHKLPPCWSSLYELSKLGDDTLESAIADGRINPKMLRKDAVALRKPSNESEEIISSPPPAEPPPAGPAPSFAAAWEGAPEAAIRAQLDAIGFARLCEIMSEKLKMEFGDHVLGQTIRSASTTSSFTIRASDQLHTALRCAEQKEPSEEDIKHMVAALKCIAREAERRGLSRSEIVIAEGKTKRRKK